MDGRNGKLIQSVAEMIVRFHGDVFPKLGEWEQRLKADPQILDTLEREVQQEFSRGAGLVVAGLIAVVMQTKEFAADAERVRQNDSVALAKGRERTMSIPLLGGVTMCMHHCTAKDVGVWGRAILRVACTSNRRCSALEKKSRRDWRAWSHGSQHSVPRLNWLGMNCIDKDRLSI